MFADFAGAWWCPHGNDQPSWPGASRFSITTIALLQCPSCTDPKMQDPHALCNSTQSLEFSQSSPPSLEFAGFRMPGNVDLQRSRLTKFCSVELRLITLDRDSSKSGFVNLESPRSLDWSSSQPSEAFDYLVQDPGRSGIGKSKPLRGPDLSRSGLPFETPPEY